MASVEQTSSSGASTPSPGARRRSILFTRLPRVGHTKTRLIPELGAEGAAELHRRLVERLLRALQADRPAGAGPAATKGVGEIELRFTGGTASELQSWLAEAEGVDVAALRFAEQGEGDLGARMHRAFVDAADQGVERALLFGADIPALGPETLSRAYEALESHDVVFGPAEDGGYYLIGLRRPQPRLFAEMSWSHPRVLEISLARAKAQGHRVALVDRLADLDEPADLERLRSDPELADLAPPRGRE
jgi:rSAM/selenodomain-associated transferase 1